MPGRCRAVATFCQPQLHRHPRLAHRSSRLVSPRTPNPVECLLKRTLAMSVIPESYAPGALYIAGFTQARSPHLGLLLAKDTTPASGTLFHIRIDRATHPNWQFQKRVQPVAGDMFLSSLLCVHGADLDAAVLEEAARSVPVPDNDEFGECGPWVFGVLQVLAEKSIVELEEVQKLADEVREFAEGSRAYARRDRFPNVKMSEFCR